MAAPIIKLEEQLSDLRSNQIAYKLTIENLGAEPIILLGLEPKVPVGAQLLEITDNEFAEDFSKKSELISELNNLLGSYLWVKSESFRENLIAVQQEAFKELFSTSNLLKLYTPIFLRRKFFENQIRSRIKSFQYKINSGEDAHLAQRTWLSNGAIDHKGIDVLFQAKLRQLEGVESRLAESEAAGSSMTTIEPESSFSATYVLKFERALLEPKKYQMSFNVRYKLSGSESPRSGSAATNIQISPSPLSLSIVAILSAVLGAILRGSLGDSSDKFAQIANLASTGQIMIGPIVALVFFNIYEHTSIGKGLDVSISWRSALLIGALCGLAQDRVLAALTALIGG
ncbi:hypothetical protein IB245_12035 [Pseudomonas sp. PDM02]|uniref:hypothetical protein n=1 Tax=Pseudomonas sp. PDM02 TaxID=2769267 RepID=UPI00177DD529|nr:hypothetical protein [Pseudomonas sp. PDM02]MBD9612231.1 hypothetical protein [Pseudomonas sp. PDM02]